MDAETRANAMVASATGESTVWLLDTDRQLIPAASLAGFGGPSVVRTVPAELLYAFPRAADLP